MRLHLIAPTPANGTVSDSFKCDVPYYMENDNESRPQRQEEKDLSLFYFTMKYGKLSFKLSAMDFAWSIHAVDTKFYCQHYNFLNCDCYRLVGYDDFAEDKVPKLDITGSDIYGEWDTALQLKLFAAIMPVIVTAIHLKRDLYQLNMAPFARNETFEDLENMKYQSKLRYAFSSITPKPQAFAGNMKSIEEYFRWYHVERAPYLQDRFTWVTLYTQNIKIIINLCDDFKVEAVIDQFNSDFMPKEMLISGIKVYLLDPALDTVASLRSHDDDDDGQRDAKVCDLILFI